MKTVQVDVHEAKSRLPELAERVRRGERVIVAEAGEPHLGLLPHGERRTPREPGALAGEIWTSDDFDDPDEELIADFEGRS